MSTTFSRAVAAETRKMLDTRTARILCATSVALAVAGPVARVLTDSPRLRVTELSSLASIGPSTLAVVLAVLLASNEFTTGTAFSTFTLDPSHRRVLAAKAVAVTGMAIAAAALCVVAAVGTGVVIGGRAVWDLAAGPVAVDVATFVFTSLCGLAVGLVLRNAAGPIVVLTVWPSLALLVAKTSHTAAVVVDHLDAQAPLQLRTHGASALVPIVVSTGVWIALPLLAAVWRLRRQEL